MPQHMAILDSSFEMGRKEASTDFIKAALRNCDISLLQASTTIYEVGRFILRSKS